MIVVVCPSCGTRHEVPPSAAGAKGKCRTCGAVIHVPRPAPVGETMPPGPAGGHANPTPAPPLPTSTHVPPVQASPAPMPPVQHAPPPIQHGPAPVPPADYSPAPAASPDAPVQPLWLPVIDGFITSFGRALSPGFFEGASRVLFAIGHWVLVALGLLILGVCSYVAVKNRDTGPVLFGGGVFLGIVLLQYVAAKLAEAGHKMVQATPSRLSSTAILKCVALAATAMLAITLGTGISICISVKSVSPLWPALMSAGVLFLIISLSSHPSLLNLTLGENSAGMEAVGLLSFLTKGLVRIAPVVYGMWAIGAALMTIDGLVRTVIRSSASAPVPVRMSRSFDSDMFETVRTYSMDAFEMFVHQLRHEITGLIYFAIAFPIAAYLIFLLYNLFIDLVVAVLKVPRLLAKGNPQEQ